MRPSGSWRPTERRSIVLGDEPGVEYLDVEDLIDLATRLLGGSPRIRDEGLLGAAAARPQTTLFGEDVYPDLWSKAAALLQSILKSHPLVDGNKRLGWLATAVFLEINGVEVTRASNEDVYTFVMDLAAGDHSVAEIALMLRRLVGGEEP